MASKSVIASSILVLRVVTLLVLAASVVLMGTNNVEFSDGTKTLFTFLHAYRYVVAVGGVGFVYTLIQLPFAIYYAATEKRWIKNGWLPEFDFLGDKVVSWLLATGVGVGFGLTFELKRFFNSISSGAVDDDASKTKDFLNRANIATGILLAGFVVMAITSILTSIKRSEKGGFFK